MNTLYSPDTIRSLDAIDKQRWLYWNVPPYFAALWVRQGQAHLGRRVGLVWNELRWSKSTTLKKADCHSQLAAATSLLVGIDQDHFVQTLHNLTTITAAAGEKRTTFGNQHGTRLFVIVLCFDCDLYLKSALLELGADYVVDRIESVPSITRMITTNGRSFPANPHPFLPMIV